MIFFMLSPPLKTSKKARMPLNCCRQAPLGTGVVGEVSDRGRLDETTLCFLLERQQDVLRLR